MDTNHFVLKRGHRGRYKFCFLDGEAALKGDVTVGVEGRSRPEQDAEALERVRELARRFGERVVLAHVGTDDVPETKEPAGAGAAGGFAKGYVGPSKGVSR